MATTFFCLNEETCSTAIIAFSNRIHLILLYVKVLPDNLILLYVKEKYTNIFSGKLALNEGERRLDRRIRDEGLQRCPGQRFTPRDGNCGPRSILHILATVTAHQCEEYDEEEPDIFRKLVCHYFLRQVKEGHLHYSEGNIQDWHVNMKKSGTHVDYYWMTGCARMLDRDILLIPTSTSSATEIGRMIRISCGYTDITYPPIFLGYLEDNIYTSGHFQALIPEMGKECPIVDYLHDGEVPHQQRSRKYPSASTSTFSLPMSTRMRIFSSLSITPPSRR